MFSFFFEEVVKRFLNGFEVLVVHFEGVQDSFVIDVIRPSFGRGIVPGLLHNFLPTCVCRLENLGFLY